MQGKSENQLEAVVNGGYCIGCGACTAIPTADIGMQLDDRGQYAPFARSGGLTVEAEERFKAVCPFSGASADESELADALFSSEGGRKDGAVGYHLSTYAGYATDPELHRNGSSGGLTSWFLYKLLDSDHVDAVINVTSANGSKRFEYNVARSPEEVLSGAKSRYYPVELSEVLKVVQDVPGRYAVVGIPCFIKSLNLLRNSDSVFSERIVITAGIFCGHMKSTNFADYLITCLGVDPNQAATVDFRKKAEDRMASDYLFEVRTVDGKVVNRPMSEIYGGNWGYGFFKNNACNYCDDLAAETADIAFGDAWLPEYVSDARGTNVVVVRTKFTQAIIKEGMNNGELTIHPIDVARVIESQAAGLRDRREGLAHRIAKKKTADEWVPMKRLSPDRSISKKREKIYDLRLAIGEATHNAFSSNGTNDLAHFESSIRPLTNQYDALYRPAIHKRFTMRTYQLLKSIYRRIKRKSG